nr:phospholipase-like, aminotransferase-like mobile domain protein [Tanacetum cinerariifolium]
MLYRGSSTGGCSTGNDDLIVVHREVNGFKFGMVSFREYRNGDIPFRNRLFPEKIGIDVKIIDVLALIKDEEKFSKVSDEDEIRLCLLLSLEVIFMGRELVSVVDDALLRMVDDLDAWNTFSWEVIPRAVAWTRKAEFFKLEYFGKLFHKALIELSPMKAEFQSNWYTPSYDFFMWYASRSPPVSIGGLYGEYLNKRSAARVAKQKYSGQFYLDLRCTQKDLLKSTSEDESNIKNNTFQDVGVVNGHVPANPFSQPIYGDFSSDLAVLNGFCNLSQSEDEKGDCERQHDDILKMAEEAKQKIESEIQRLYDHREARLNKIAEEEKERQLVG